MTLTSYKSLLLLLILSISACTNFFRDDFELDDPPKSSINIDFPSLVRFKINQTIHPDLQNISNEVSNSFTIINELDQPIQQLKFGINIFDSTTQFEENLLVAYIDSIQQGEGKIVSYLCLGKGMPEGYTAYVLRRNTETNHVELWNACKGLSYYFGREE